MASAKKRERDPVPSLKLKSSPSFFFFPQRRDQVRKNPFK